LIKLIVFAFPILMFAAAELVENCELKKVWSELWARTAASSCCCCSTKRTETRAKSRICSVATKEALGLAEGVLEKVGVAAVDWDADDWEFVAVGMLIGPVADGSAIIPGGTVGDATSAVALSLFCRRAGAVADAELSDAPGDGTTISFAPPTL